MIPDVSKALSWLEANPHALEGVRRGVERETLRIAANGHLSQAPHPEVLGAPLTHKWVTTDFAEALLEFITPADDDIDHMLAFLRDIHRYVARNLGEERMWPMSMPCFIDHGQPIELAQYGSSNIGRYKTLYREGLKNRYGALMQVISGVHYNFSLPLAFWQARLGVADDAHGKEQISAGYLSLIRNYYRFGWIIPYLFGASPAVCSSFLDGRKTHLPFERAASGIIYLPYATSLRLSDLGYTNKSQSQLGITFNRMDEYIAALKRAIKVPSAEYQRIGLERNGERLQVNTNVLQSEHELYAPIRPKRVTRVGESPSDALVRAGIEYIEVRSLDINPFSPIGIDQQQARFLDLFLIWCTLAEAPDMSSEELQCARANWDKVVLEGRKPGLTLSIDCGAKQQPLAEVGKGLFEDLRRVAVILDNNNQDHQYRQACDNLVAAFDSPELTFSARILAAMKEQGIGGLGLMLASNYRRTLCDEPFEIFTEDMLATEQARSRQRQIEIESEDTLSFEQYLDRHNAG